MREMSRFSCTVGVLVDGNCMSAVVKFIACLLIPASVVQECDSSNLLPGDVVNLNYPELSLVPADMLLLSGDAIVNESMLTGESVPISKTSIVDSDLAKWRETGEITAETAKGFLYTGTRVIRIRGPSSTADTRPALAMVVRTGPYALYLVVYFL